jgi:hypothetical protein
MPGNNYTKRPTTWTYCFLFFWHLWCRSLFYQLFNLTINVLPSSTFLCYWIFLQRFPISLLHNRPNHLFTTNFNYYLARSSFPFPSSVCVEYRRAKYFIPVCSSVSGAVMNTLTYFNCIPFGILVSVYHKRLSVDYWYMLPSSSV